MNEVSTTTCSYEYIELTTNVGTSTCNTVASSTASTTPFELSTDPVLAVIAAAGLMLYAATYVRRVFFS